MLPITIRTPPKVEDYIPLAEYQSTTPASFHGGKPVLHFHTTGVKGWLPVDSVGILPVFPMAEKEKGPTEPENKVLGSKEREKAEQIVDVFVTTENFTLYNHAAQVGVSIPYPLIAIHAATTLKHDGISLPTIWLQIQLSDSSDEYTDTELTLIPEASTVQNLYTAISSCSDLHPGPTTSKDDEDYYPDVVIEGSAEHKAVEEYSVVWKGDASGGLPPALPGSEGWITAENVHEYFDEEGNWKGREGEDGEKEGVSGELGEGAGRVRAREEVEAEAEKLGEQEASGETESKKARVD